MHTKIGGKIDKNRDQTMRLQSINLIKKRLQGIILFTKPPAPVIPVVKKIRNDKQTP